MPPLPPVQVGQDRLSSAFTEMMNEDPKAQGLLDQAMDKFEVGGCRRGVFGGGQSQPGDGA